MTAVRVTVVECQSPRLFNRMKKEKSIKNLDLEINSPVPSFFFFFLCNTDHHAFFFLKKQILYAQDEKHLFTCGKK